ncbi:MAG: hypothetical protein ACAI25_01110 [Planctomycetota bacterium]
MSKLVRPARPRLEKKPAKADKKCPECAEMIKGVAKVCRFCGWRSVTLKKPNRCECGGVYTEEAPWWASFAFGYLGSMMLGFRKKRCALCNKPAR